MGGGDGPGMDPEMAALERLMAGGAGKNTLLYLT